MFRFISLQGDVIQFGQSTKEIHEYLVEKQKNESDCLAIEISIL